MKFKLITLLFSILVTAAGVSAQTSWLDRPMTNWNNSANVPMAPRATGDLPTNSRCLEMIRNPESISDRALTRAGWTLFGASQTYGAVTLIHGMASVDGMCRPNQFNSFVFVANRFAGTLSPTVMNSRSDGALSEARLNSASNIVADFTRYTSSDALCCPSQTSSVVYTINNGRVSATTVETTATCQNQTEPVENENGVVRGTITYRSRMGQIRNWTINVRLLETARTDAQPVTVSEQRIEVSNQQVPIPFEIRFDPNRINQRRAYSVQAEIVSNGRIIFTTDRVYPVLTQGNPQSVDITLVPSGNFGNPTNNGQNNSVLRGTVAYREKILLPDNASIKVQLIDAATTESGAMPMVVAETIFGSNRRQVPIPFELPYNSNTIDQRRLYVVRAEITVDGRVDFVTKTTYNVVTAGNPIDNVQIILVPGNAAAPVVTGQTLSLSKFGTGSIQIEGRNSDLLLRGSVNVKPDGTADVAVSRFNGGTIFTGKLIYFDQNMLRISVESSGNANAGGEIEIKYSGRRLDTIIGKDLTLDGQKVTLQF